MGLLSVIASIVHLALLLYIIVLFARLILECIPLFNREWRPKGTGLVAAEVVYTITDPPVRFFRRIIPPTHRPTVAGLRVRADHVHRADSHEHRADLHLSRL